MKSKRGVTDTLNDLDWESVLWSVKEYDWVYIHLKNTLLFSFIKEKYSWIRVLVGKEMGKSSQLTVVLPL